MRLAIRELLTGYLGESGVPEMEQLLRTVGLVSSACQVTDISKLLPNRDAQAEQHAEPQPVAALPVQQVTDWRSVQVHEPRQRPADAGKKRNSILRQDLMLSRTADD